MRHWLLLLLFGLIQISGYTQTFSGKISYKISFKDSLGNPVVGMEEQKIAEYLNDTLLRVDQDSRAGMQTTLINFSDSSYHILMDMQGVKLAIIMPENVFETADSLKPKIKYKCKSKTIAGQKCKLAQLTYPDGREQDVYYAKKIPGKFNQKFYGLKGYPMSYQLDERGFELSFEATDVNTSPVDKSYLSIPEDYRRMTMDDFMKALSE